MIMYLIQPVVGRCNPVGVRPARTRLHVAAAVRRAKTSIKRKDLQKQVQVEYIKSFYEDAQKIENGELVIELKEATPKQLAQERQEQQVAALNQRLSDDIAQLSSWQQVQQLLQQHGPQLNYLNVSMLCYKLSLLQPADATADSADAAAGSQQPPPSQQQQQQDQQHAALLSHLAALVQQRMSWYRSHQFVQTAVGLSACGLRDTHFWNLFVREMDRKLMAFSSAQLANVLASLASAGYVPSKNWLERTERQAAKHLHTSTAGDLSSLFWAWGEWHFTPQRMFTNMAKDRMRGKFRGHEFSAQQLVRLMHGVARLAAHRPRDPWLLAYANEVRRVMHQLAPGDILEVLAALVALGYKPPEQWLKLALGQLQRRGFASFAGEVYEVAAGQGEAAAGAVDGWEAVGDSAAVLDGGAACDGGDWLDEPGWEGADEGEQGAEAAEEEEEQEQQQAAVTRGPATNSSSNFGAQQQEHPTVDTLPSSSTSSVTHQQHTPPPPPAAASSTALATHMQQQPQQDEQQESDQLGAVLLWDPDSPLAAAAQQQALLLPLSLDQLSLLAWCLDALDYVPPSTWMDSFVRELYGWLPHMQPHHAGDILLAVAGVDYLPSEVFVEVYLQRVAQLMGSLPAAALANVLRALALLDYEPEPQWGQAALQRCQQVLPDLQPAELVDTVASLAYLCITPPAQLMAGFEERSMGHLADMQPQKLATLLWGYAVLGFKPAGTWLQLALATLQPKLKFLDVRELANVVWALAVLKHQPTARFLEAFLLLTMPKLGYMPPRSLVDMAWALASLGARPSEPWCLRLSQAVGGSVGQLGQGDLAVVLWAMERFRFVVASQPVLQQMQGVMRGAAGSGSTAAAAVAAV